MLLRSGKLASISLSRQAEEKHTSLWSWLTRDFCRVRRYWYCSGVLENAASCLLLRTEAGGNENQPGVFESQDGLGKQTFTGYAWYWCVVSDQMNHNSDCRLESWLDCGSKSIIKFCFLTTVLMLTLVTGWLLVELFFIRRKIVYSIVPSIPHSDILKIAFPSRVSAWTHIRASSCSSQRWSNIWRIASVLSVMRRTTTASLRWEQFVQHVRRLFEELWNVSCVHKRALPEIYAVMNVWYKKRRIISADLPRAKYSASESWPTSRHCFHLEPAIGNQRRQIWWLVRSWKQ